MSASLVERLRRLDACCVSDALDALAMNGAVTGIPRRSGAGTVAGRAVTVTLAAGPAPAGTPKVHLGARAIEAGDADSVIVVSHPGNDAGGWGGVLTQAARCAGIQGVIVDGPLRDMDEANGLDFPIFARATTVRTARARVHEVATNAPIEVASVAIAPGDYVIADGSGAVFIPAAEAERVIATAERIAAKERLMVEALKAGKPVSQVLGADYEDMLEAMQ
ncbi:diguanylate cyclase [Youhaiella tibetensis]|uniref:Putative 4-hydroxy-4-methyl-2-oxoglutarate aldolase n=1 Tax=Paradevosia tibetensis TaxID=1447062 RepID=A0A5B9DHB7_9HYPH|nr:RraA family protein [Youhaiella tibetensis]QEE18700.1 RraA family protein [Youhaiella tibetensis]GGF40011.1 diguanylate cyclase [Youhaiella tibetensis]